MPSDSDIAARKFPTGLDWELIDVGQGRKLERFANVLVDRPLPAADGLPRGLSAEWQRADFRSIRQDDGSHRWVPALDHVWNIAWGRLTLQLRLTPSGQVGLFPEHLQFADSLARRIRENGGTPRVLNLFAYTGALTLAAAAAGAQVTHVDASRPAVRWARTNAALSGLDAAPVRWITDDARQYVRRELARGGSYDVIILDPPSYGHGPKGRPWFFRDDLPELLGNCARLLRGDKRSLVLTSHTPGFEPGKLRALIAPFASSHRLAEECGSLVLAVRDGRTVILGAFASMSD